MGLGFKVEGLGFRGFGGLGFFRSLEVLGWFKATGFSQVNSP